MRALALAFAVAAAGCHSIDASVCPPRVPGAVNPPPDETLSASYDASGKQIYVCEKGSNGTYFWNNLGAQANLYDEKKKLAGTHFFGPTWQANDGSSAIGTKTAAVTVDGSAIPWMLLKAQPKAKATSTP